MDGRRSRSLSGPVMGNAVVSAISFLLIIIAPLSRIVLAATETRNVSRPYPGPLRVRQPSPISSRMMNVDAIVKEVQNIRYPVDGYWLRFQEKVPDSVQFPCGSADGKGNGPRWRSAKRPTSVHLLRPGDVDVVGAVGDSLTSSTAAREILFSFVQDRGVSFSAGGIGTWRTITTMPNILKVFNPKLIGYSVGRGDFLSYNAQLNVAITSAIDDDTLTQTKLFVKKMKLDPRINFTSDWKVLSMFIGHNDICSMHCIDGIKHAAEDHKQQLQKALNYLYKEVPRIFVNVISIIDPSLTARVSTSPVCSLLRRIGCSCLYRNGNYTRSLLEMSKLAHEYHEAEKDLVFSGQYSGREDFTVELQSFLRSTVGPQRMGDPDKASLIQFLNGEKLWTPECMHFNQRGLAIASILLWNNMMEPAGNKSETFKKMTYKNIKCPTKEVPYLFTQKNTESYYTLGHQ